MTPELRQQIFALAAQDVPRRQIAARLGISEGSVRYQLDRPARPEANGAADLPIPPASPAGPADDPLAEARRQLALEQTTVAQINLRAQRLEAERRMQLLERAATGDQGAILLVLDALKDLRRDLDQVRAQAVRPAAPPAAPPPSELEVLERVQRQTQLLQSIAPSRPPSTAAELELQVAKDKLDLEREERMRRLDADLEERRRALENERIRAEAVAEQIRYWGPIIGQGVQQWFAKEASAPAAGNGNANPAPGPRPGLTVLTPEGKPQTIGMIEGPCPSCGIALGITPDGKNSERCPRCTQELVVVNGKIWPKLPPDTAPRFAS